MFTKSSKDHSLVIENKNISMTPFVLGQYVRLMYFIQRNISITAETNKI